MYDLIIIGAGPAGLVAGLYAGRYRLNSLILEKMAPGGQIILSLSIENYPGFPGGIATQDLIEKVKAQVDGLGIKIEDREVLGIKAKAHHAGFDIETPEGVLETKTIIVATGAVPKMLEAEGEKRLVGRGVSYCGTCDAPLFKDKEVIVVGGGDKAVEEAIYLTSYASKVTIVHRRAELRASKILEEKAKKNAKLHFMLDSVIEQIIGENKVEGVKIRNVLSGKVTDFTCAGVFVFVGIKPSTGFLKNLLSMDELGFIIVDSEMKTSQAGVFAAGDCCRKGLYQVITACGDGASAADSAHKYILLKK